MQDVNYAPPPPRGGSTLLHNMSTRPTTQVEATVLAGRGERISIALDRLRASPLFDGATGRESRARAVAARAAELLPELDAAWARLGLSGAVLLWKAPPGAVTMGIDNEDPIFAINILARAQGEILIARAPAVLDPVRLARSFATDDPRLVAVVDAAFDLEHEGDRP